MPDFSMCNDSDCPWRFRCMRNPESGTRPTMYQQSWSMFVKTGPMEDPNNCSGFRPKLQEKGYD